nr:MAG TPA: hypothetical protein [Caudoviricetes sp.]
MFLLKHRKSIFIIQGYEVTRNLSLFTPCLGHKKR